MLSLGPIFRNNLLQIMDRKKIFVTASHENKKNLVNIYTTYNEILAIKATYLIKNVYKCAISSINGL